MGDKRSDDDKHTRVDIRSGRETAVSEEEEGERCVRMEESPPGRGTCAGYNYSAARVTEGREEDKEMVQTDLELLPGIHELFATASRT
jgi:hypothetical protein